MVTTFVPVAAAEEFDAALDGALEAALLPPPAGLPPQAIAAHANIKMVVFKHAANLLFIFHSSFRFPEGRGAQNLGDWFLSGGDRMRGPG